MTWVRALPHEESADGIYVAPNRSCTQLEGLAKCRAASHEWIQHHLVFEVVPLVKGPPDVGIRIGKRAECDPAEHRPQPGGPPLVNVVGRSVDLLAPTLALGQCTDLSGWKASFQGCLRFAWRCPSVAGILNSHLSFGRPSLPVAGLGGEAVCNEAVLLPRVRVSQPFCV